MRFPGTPGSAGRRPPQEPQTPAHAPWSALVKVVESVALAFVIALLINFFLAQSTYVHGQSMEPNLHTDQRLIVEKVSYKLRPPRRGEIVIINPDHTEIPLIKRVIGLPGETVEIRDNRVFVDGIALQEDYLVDVVQPNYGPSVVPAGHVFVMGDNRGASNDSRAFGAVPTDRIVARAWISYWPLEDVQLFR